MIRSAVAISLSLFCVAVGYVLKECAFLSPVKGALWECCWGQIAGFMLVLLVNLFSAVYLLMRRITLQSTGDKLTHLEKQLRGRRTISEELTERLLGRK